MSGWLAAGAWGLLGGAALVIGAALAWFVRIPRLVVASVMAFGAGVLISALAFDLVAEAEASGGLPATVVGFLAGASVYVLANAALARRGARHRKRSQSQQPSEEEQPGSGAAIAVGALLDGVPESVVLGASLLGGGGVSTTVIAAVFISNLPEGLSSAAGMRAAGRSARYVFGVWVGIAVASAAAAALGYQAPGGGLAAGGRGHHRRGGRRDPHHARRHHDPRGLRAHPPAHRADRRDRVPRRVHHQPARRLNSGPPRARRQGWGQCWRAAAWDNVRPVLASGARDSVIAEATQPGRSRRNVHRSRRERPPRDRRRTP